MLNSEFDKEGQNSDLDHWETTIKSGELYYICATTVPNHRIPDSIECFRPATLWNGEFEKDWYQVLEGKTYKKPVNLVHYYSLPTTKQVFTRRTTRRIQIDDRIREDVYDEKWERFAKLMGYDERTEKALDKGEDKEGKKKRRRRELRQREEENESVSDDVEKIKGLEREISREWSAVVSNGELQKTINISRREQVINATSNKVNNEDRNYVDNNRQTSQLKQKDTDQIKGDCSTHRQHKLLVHVEDLVNIRANSLNESDRVFINATRIFPTLSRNQFEINWYNGTSNSSKEDKEINVNNVGQLVMDIPVHHNKVETFVGSISKDGLNKTYQIDILIPNNKTIDQSNSTENTNDATKLVTVCTKNTTLNKTIENSTATFNNADNECVPHNIFNNDKQKHISQLENLAQRLDTDLANVVMNEETQRVDEQLDTINDTLIEKTLPRILQKNIQNQSYNVSDLSLNNNTKQASALLDQGKQTNDKDFTTTADDLIETSLAEHEAIPKKIELLSEAVDFFLNNHINSNITLTSKDTQNTNTDFVTANTSETTLKTQETVTNQLQNRLFKVIDFYLKYKRDKSLHKLVKRNLKNSKGNNDETIKNDPNKPCIQNVDRAKFYKFLKMVHVNVSKPNKDEMERHGNNFNGNIVNDKTTKFSLGNCKKYFLLPLDYDYNRLVKD